MGNSFTKRKDRLLKITSIIMIILAIGIIVYGEKSFHQKVDTRVDKGELVVVVEDIKVRARPDVGAVEESLLSENTDTGNNVVVEDPLPRTPSKSKDDFIITALGKASAITKKDGEEGNVDTAETVESTVMDDIEVTEDLDDGEVMSVTVVENPFVEAQVNTINLTSNYLSLGVKAGLVALTCTSSKMMTDYVESK